MLYIRLRLFVALLLVSIAFTAGPVLGSKAAADEQGPFLGIFTHVEPHAAMADKLVSLKSVLSANPLISGIDLKIEWRQLHPEKDRVDWAGLEALVATAAAAHKKVVLGILPGAASPDWIYAVGARHTDTLTVGRFSGVVPIPWDEKFEGLFLDDLVELARRYDNDPRVMGVEVLGQNYGPSGEEMHAPPANLMAPYGWTREVALDNWRFWIDRYNALFAHKKLGLVISQMYPGADPELPRLVAEYFTHAVPGRAILRTAQLNGRQDGLVESGEICRDLAHFAPNCDEMVGSFKEQPARQGSAEMTIYNARQMGDNLLYLQLWRRDATDPQYAQALLDAWDRYGHLPLPQCKALLIADGKYLAPGSSTWKPAL